MPSLVAAGDIASLVFDPDPTVFGEAQRVTQGIGPIERRAVEAGSGDSSDVYVNLPNHRRACDLGHPVRRRETVPREVRLKRDERVDVVVASQWRDALNELQRMMRIGVVGAWASPDQRRGDVDMRAAHRA